MTTPTHPDDYVSTRHDTDFLGSESGPAHHVPFERVPPLADMPAADGDDSPFEAVAHPSELADGGLTGHDMGYHAEHHAEVRAEPHLGYEQPDEDEDRHQEAHGVAPARGQGYAHEGSHDDGHEESREHAEHAGGSHGSNGIATPDHAIARATSGAVTTPVTAPAQDSVSAAADARGMLEGVAQSLRTLAGREGADGASIAIFPRGVDLLEVRMHISRERDIDLNFRVAGPTPPGSSI